MKNCIHKQIGGSIQNKNSLNQTEGFFSNEKKELEPGSESLLRSKN